MVCVGSRDDDDGKGSSCLSTEPTLKIVNCFLFLFLLRTKGVILVLYVKNLFQKTD